VALRGRGGGGRAPVRAHPSVKWTTQAAGVYPKMGGPQVNKLQVGKFAEKRNSPKMWQFADLRFANPIFFYEFAICRHNIIGDLKLCT
jgi:hypothetical protein